MTSASSVINECHSTYTDQGCGKLVLLFYQTLAKGNQKTLKTTKLKNF